MKKLLSSELIFEFEGNRPSRIRNWFGKNAKKVLSDSKWLQHDPNLTEFVKSCFGHNRVKSFSCVVEYVDVGSAVEMASIAASCELPGASGKVRSKHDTIVKHLKERSIIYTVEF